MSMMPTEKRISYAKPEASPKPVSMVEVKVLVVEKRLKVGPARAFPQTMETAVASPKERLSPMIRPAKIPLLAAGRMTLKLVSLLLAPKANEALESLGSTAFMAEIDKTVIVGMLIIERTKTEERVDMPPADWNWNKEERFLTTLLIKPSPNIP